MDADLDDLLNDALSDFDKPPASGAGKSEEKGDGGVPTTAGASVFQVVGSDTEGASLQPPTEIFDQFFDKDIAKSLQREWESAMRELAEDDPELASQVNKLSSTLENLPEASMEAGASGGPPASDGEAQSSTGASSLDQIMGAAISGIGQSAEETKNMTSTEAEQKLLHDFQKLGLGGGMSGMMGQMGNMEGSEEGFMSMMENMMQNLLSKDVLYPTMKEIAKVYPQWLDENEEAVPTAELRRYKKQRNIIDEICKSFEAETDSDSKEVKGERLNVMMNLVEQMQECGNPPKDLLEKCAGASPGDMSKFFGEGGFDPSTIFGQGELQNADGCSVM